MRAIRLTGVENMSTSINIMRSRAGAMTQIGESLSNRVASIAAYLAARAERNRVYAELSRLSDRDLADIGISRGEVPRVAGFSDAMAPSLFTNRA